jgi:hypothetical protein
MSGVGSLRAVWRALIYLYAVSIFNAVRARLKRLREPRYAIGALVGVAYLWFAIGAPRGGSFHGSGVAPDLRLMTPELVPVWTGLAAVMLFLLAAMSWVIAGNRAALRFTEAEVAFLFPAPMTRRMLIHYKLLRLQLTTLISSIVLALLFRRGGGGLGANLMFAAGWWLLFSNMSLHQIAASFWRERLLDLGVSPLLRRIVAGALAFALLAGGWWWLRAHMAVEGIDEVPDLRAVGRYFEKFLAQQPLPILLAPFRWAVAPMFASDVASFAAAAWPALALLAFHYVLVIRSDTAFEEASVDLARREAERVAAMREGKFSFGRPKTKATGEPFRLRERGRPEVAFLWKGLVAMGPVPRLRNFLLAAGAILVVGAWLRAAPERKAWLEMVSSFATFFVLWLPLMGPILMTQRLRQAFDRFDLIKPLPVDGRQFVFGELAAPILVMTGLVWLFLLAGAQASLDVGARGDLGSHALLLATLIAVLCVPPLFGLLMCVPMAAFALLPAWTVVMSNRGGGIEAAGQRMIFFLAYFLALAASLLPAGLLAGLVYFAVRWLAGELPAAIAGIGTLSAALVVEFIGAAQWVGDRIEGLDLATETAA